MLRITVDIFSGRPNPTWIAMSDATTRKVLGAVAENRRMIGKPGAGFQGLGLRGVRVERLGNDDEDARAAKVPAEFTLLTGRGESLRAGGRLVASLIKEMIPSKDVALPEHAQTPLNKRMQALLLEELAVFLEKPPRLFRPVGPISTPVRRTVRDQKCARCQYEISRFNPGFWNNDPAVRTSNNCYNYARNWRTNTFAQPGRASGQTASSMSCAAVADAARRDGLVDRCRCLPQSEYPRRHVALVIWPGVDYHWYREQIGGFWGHKPGQTAAKNTDNAGALITSPETCDRGGYTHFCGYFYAGKSVKII